MFVFLFSLIIIKKTQSICELPPNIDYVSRSYNIMYGNPYTTGGFDNGFSGAIFDLVCNDTSPWTSPNGTIFGIPNGANLVGSDTCSLTQSYAAISGLSSYSSTLFESVDVSADSSGLLWKAAFSVSEDYQTVSKQTISDKSVVISSYAKCGYYEVSLNTPYAAPALSKNFYEYILNMPTTYSENADYFYNFINYDFGTHYLKKLSMGGRYGQRSQFTSYSYSSFSSSNLDIAQSASFSTLDVGGSESSMTNTSKQQANDFNQATESQTQFFVGGQLPSDGNANTWQMSLSTSPMPQEYTLESIHTLLIPSNFPDINQTILQQKQTALYEALQYYCQQLSTNYSNIYCAGLPSDLALPNNSIFGGIYDYSNDNKYNMNNMYTKELNCKKEFKPFIVGQYMQCNNDNIIDEEPINVNLCLNTTKIVNGTLKDGMNYFGGIFSETTCNGSQNWQSYNNPFTKNTTCLPGFTKQIISKYITYINGYVCEPNYMYYCYNKTESIDNSIIAGFYQNANNVNYNIVNQYTNSASCPDGFTPYPISQVTAHYDQSNVKCINADVYVCLNNIYEL